MAVTTIFKNFAEPVEDISLIILSNRVASDKYKIQVEEIRGLIAQGKTEEAQAKSNGFQPLPHPLHSQKTIATQHGAIQRICSSRF